MEKTGLCIESHNHIEAGAKLFPGVGCKLLWGIAEGFVAVAVTLFTYLFFSSMKFWVGKEIHLLCQLTRIFLCTFVKESASSQFASLNHRM